MRTSHCRARGSIGAIVIAVLPGAISAQQIRPSFSNSGVAIGRRQANYASIAWTGSRSILLTGAAATPRVIVWLHGLTDSPRQFESLAYLLHGVGINVYVPRLPNYGLRVEGARAMGSLSEAQRQGRADSVLRITRGPGESL